MHKYFTPDNFEKAHEAAHQTLQAWENAMVHALKAREAYELAKRALSNKKADIFLQQDTGTVKEKEARTELAVDSWAEALHAAQVALREAEFVVELARREHYLARDKVDYIKGNADD